jgi:toxin YhaV
MRCGSVIAKKSAARGTRVGTNRRFENIPRDPTAAEFRQGDTLGPKYKHWFRAKFFMQYRLFLRFHVKSKVIALGWVNDEDTKPAYGTKDDAYRVFSKMLAAGHPPDDWNAL